MLTRNRAFAACAMVALTAAAPSVPRIYGLSSGNANAFTVAPDGRAISILFDTFKADRSSPPSKPKLAPVRRVTLAASPTAAGCRISLTLRGAALAGETSRVGTVTVNVDGQTTRLLPQSDIWTLTMHAALGRRERTDVAITLDLPTPEDEGSAMLELDSVDIVLGKCRGRK